jgi:hypothetical protein
MQYTTRGNDVLHCELMRVNAITTGSIRISVRNWNPCKNFEHDQNFSLPYRIPGIHQELTRVTMRVEPDRYGFNSVWTRLKIRLCVIVVPECRPHSKLFDPCGPAFNSWLINPHQTVSTCSGKYKRKSLWHPFQLALTRFDPQRLLPTCTCPFHFPWTNVKSVYQNRI